MERVERWGVACGCIDCRASNTLNPETATRGVITYTHIRPPQVWRSSPGVATPEQGPTGMSTTHIDSLKSRRNQGRAPRGAHTTRKPRAACLSSRCCYHLGQPAHHLDHPAHYLEHCRPSRRPTTLYIDPIAQQTDPEALHTDPKTCTPILQPHQPSLHLHTDHTLVMPTVLHNSEHTKSVTILTTHYQPHHPSYTTLSTTAPPHYQPHHHNISRSTTVVTPPGEGQSRDHPGIPPVCVSGSKTFKGGRP